MLQSCCTLTTMRRCAFLSRCSCLYRLPTRVCGAVNTNRFVIRATREHGLRSTIVGAYQSKLLKLSTAYSRFRAAVNDHPKEAIVIYITYKVFCFFCYRPRGGPSPPFSVRMMSRGW